MDKTNEKNNKEVISKAISLIRFPLIVLVVFLHTDISSILNSNETTYASLVWGGGNMLIYSNLSFLVSKIISRSAVPLFFFISGFLFFFNVKTFSKDSYIRKLRRRVKSLLVPYIFWNAVVIFLLYLSQTLIPGMNSEGYKPIMEYRLSDWLSAFWSIRDNTPICYQFWFIRDLMVMVLLTPMFYLFIKRTKVLPILVFGLLWLFNICSLGPGLSLTAIFFFSLGSYFSLNEINLTFLKKGFYVLCIGYMSLLALTMLSRNTFIYDVIHNVTVFVGVFLMLAISYKLALKNKVKPCRFLTEGSFFVYAYHGIFLTLLIKIASKVLTVSQNDFTATCTYLACPLIIVSGGLIIYKFLKSKLPGFTSIIIGAR